MFQKHDGFFTSRYRPRKMPADRSQGGSAQTGATRPSAWVAAMLRGRDVVKYPEDDGLGESLFAVLFHHSADEGDDFLRVFPRMFLKCAVDRGEHIFGASLHRDA